MSAEASIVLLNCVILALAYGSVYPKFAGTKLNRIAYCDLAASLLAIFIVATKYWGSEQNFELFSFQLNWFWFTLLSYSLIEVPIALWYFSKK